MAWNDSLPKQPERAQQPWLNNDDIWIAWKDFYSSRGADNTKRNMENYTGAFFQSYDFMVTTLTQEDIEMYIARLESKCSKLMNAKKPICLASEDVYSCPVLLGKTPFTSCVSYQPLLPSATLSHITAIHRFYAWLIEEGRVSRNPVLRPMHDFKDRNKAFFEERQEDPDRRDLTTAEVKLLATRTPIQIGISVMFMAKCFLRIHEALTLTWDPKKCNLDEGWMLIPREGEHGAKRKGNRKIILDAEMLTFVRLYRQWWEMKVKLDPEGHPITNQVMLTQFGLPREGKYASGNLNNAIQSQSIRLGLMTGTETDRGERVNSHCFRAWATTVARELGADNTTVEIMRGDLGRNATLARYDNYHARLTEMYANFGPQLGI